MSNLDSSIEAAEAVRVMATKGQMNGMRGVYLVAAELSKLGFIVSPTSRSAAGADLLVTDQLCCKAWSVQVKTNAKPAGFWLVGAHASRLKSDSHAYVFVNLGKSGNPEYIVASSTHVASKVVEFVSKTKSVWWAFYKKDRPNTGEGWELFGDPYAPAEPVFGEELLPPTRPHGEEDLVRPRLAAPAPRG